MQPPPQDLAAAQRAVLQAHTASASPANAASALVAFVAVALLHGVVASHLLAAWLGALALTLGLRLELLRRLAREGSGPVDAAKWIRRFRAGALLHGLAWGALGLLPLQGDGVLASLALLLGGLAAGAMTLALFDLRAGLAFAVPAALPLALRLALGPAPVPPLLAVIGLTLLMLAGLAGFTARRSARQLHDTGALLAQKSRVLEVTLDSLSQGVISFDTEGRVNAWNRRALALLDLPEALMQQRPTLLELGRWQLAQNHFGSDLAAMDEIGRHGLERFLGGDGRSIAERYQRVKADGTVLDVQSHFADDGSLVRTYTDVTEAVKAEQALRESETRFRTMADSAPALIWLSDELGRQTWFNQRWLRFRGTSMLEELAQTWQRRIHPDDYERCRETFAGAFDGRRPYDIEFRLQRADGGWGWIADSGIPRFDPTGRFDGYISYSWEIDERKAAEAALIAARDEAERANRAKSQFLSRMSHELRTPLNAILGFGQLLELDAREPLTPGQRVSVGQMLRGGRHLLALINEVLDLARIESGAVELQLEPVDLGALVSDCLRLVQPVAADAAITLQAAPLAAGLRVQADRRRLEQVLLNLLSNAIKYNRPAGRVHVACRTEGDRVVLEVGDEGPGLSAAQQQRLFQAFERLDADRSAIEGAGIGLALSKWLVGLMAGEIGVRSEVGAGSTFWVRLALSPAEATGPAGAADQPAPPPVPVHDHTVLYIEDNAVNQLLMQGMLAQRPGIRLQLAAEPLQGLAMAAADPPDLVLLDIQLPGIDGFEVLRRLREHGGPRVPVVAVSANAMPDDLEAARRAGFDDYLTKPLDLQRLLAVVDQALA